MFQNNSSRNDIVNSRKYNNNDVNCFATKTGNNRINNNAGSYVSTPAL